MTEAGWQRKGGRCEKGDSMLECALRQKLGHYTAKITSLVQPQEGTVSMPKVFLKKHATNEISISQIISRGRRALDTVAGQQPHMRMKIVKLNCGSQLQHNNKWS